VRVFLWARKMDHEKIAIEDGLLTPQFLSRAEEELFAEVMLGDEAVTFLNTDLGRVLRGYAMQEMEKAKDALASVPAWRTRKIRKLQFDYAVANQFLSFVQEALVRGKVAEQNLTSMREQS